jgi:hypothetical protein
MYGLKPESITLVKVKKYIKHVKRVGIQLRPQLFLTKTMTVVRKSTNLNLCVTDSSLVGQKQTPRNIKPR